MRVIVDACTSSRSASELTVCGPCRETTTSVRSWGIVTSFDVVVVGGGIVGTATAFELGRAGARTLLVDRAEVGRATDAGAGILSPETAKRDDTAWVDLVRAAGRHYDQLLPQLDPDNGWARCGILQLATRDSDLSAWAGGAEDAGGAAEDSADEARDMVAG